MEFHLCFCMPVNYNDTTPITLNGSIKWLNVQPKIYVS